MIVGIVNEYREAIIRLIIHGLNGKKHVIEAVIDTGFNGSISLPSVLIAELELPFRSRGRAILANGSETIFDIYEATVRPRRVAVDEADTDALIGMSLLYGYELNIQVTNGGNVFIDMLPDQKLPT